MLLSYNAGISPQADAGDIIVGGVAGGQAVSEFWDKLLQLIIKSVYTALYQSVGENLQGLFDSLNRELSHASRQITLGPKLWNGSAYGLMQDISENVCIPIAAAFITVIFCWELIHLVQESNSMQNIQPERLMLVLIKFALCLVVCAYSFRIVMCFCDIGSWAGSKLRGATVSISMAPSLADLGLPEDGYTLENLMKLAGYKVTLVLASFGIWICGILVYIRVMLWFVEYLLYASTAPIPFSTCMNKEWSQTGMNYTRKMLALSFEGFFILLLFSVYGGVLSGLQLGDFKQSLVMVIGCGFGLAVMMFKVGNISASIFNAH